MASWPLKTFVNSNGPTEMWLIVLHERLKYSQISVSKSFCLGTIHGVRDELVRVKSEDKSPH